MESRDGVRVGDGGEQGQSSGVIGQAIYTWASEHPTGERGFAFSAMSPSVDEVAAWFRARTTALTPFTGKHQLTQEERVSFRPLGRKVLGERAVVFRKVDGGTDSHNRRGRYVVHFLVGTPESLTLTDLLQIPPRIWLGAAEVPLDSRPTLTDLSSESVRRDLIPWLDSSLSDLATILNPIEQLLRRGEADIGEIPNALLLDLLSCMPVWFDRAGELTHEWESDGPSRRISLAELDNAHLRSMSGSEDHRPIPTRRDLVELRARLDRAQTLEEIGLDVGILQPRVSLGEPIPSSRAPLQRSMSDLVRNWSASGRRGFLGRDVLMLEAEPRRVLEILVEERLSLPQGRRPDPLGVQLLRRVDDLSVEVIAALLPPNDVAAGDYVGLVPALGLLSKIALLHARSTRRIPISLDRPLPLDVSRGLVELAKEDHDHLKGLIAMVRASSDGDGSLVRSIAGTPGVDYNFLFSRVIPEVAGKEMDTLLGLSSLAPAEFVAWLGCPSPYDRALVEAFTHGSHQAIWRRISAFIGRWRNLQPRS